MFWETVYPERKTENEMKRSSLSKENAKQKKMSKDCRKHSLLNIYLEVNICLSKMVSHRNLGLTSKYIWWVIPGMDEYWYCKYNNFVNSETLDLYFRKSLIVQFNELRVFEKTWISFNENCFTASFTIILNLNTPLLHWSLLISLTVYSQRCQQALLLECFFFTFDA